MTRYVEPTLRTRQLFFLAVLVLAGLVFFASRMNQLLPPLSNELLPLMEQVSARSFWSAVATTAFFVGLSSVAVSYTRRAVQSKQWPPAGITVPFRMKVVEIKRPIVAWLYLGALLAPLTLQTALPWYKYSRLQTEFKEIKALVNDPAPNKALQPTSHNLLAQVVRRD